MVQALLYLNFQRGLKGLYTWLRHFWSVSALSARGRFSQFSGQWSFDWRESRERFKLRGSVLTFCRFQKLHKIGRRETWEYRSINETVWYIRVVVLPDSCFILIMMIVKLLLVSRYLRKLNGCANIEDLFFFSIL